MAVFTANPITLNREQIIRTETVNVFTASVVDPVRGTIHIEAACVSILGSIQPRTLQAYLLQCSRQGLDDDGLIQRFQLAVWPDVSSEWRNVDRWPNSEAREAAYKVFTEVNDINPQQVEALKEEDDVCFSCQG